MPVVGLCEVYTLGTEPPRSLLFFASACVHVGNPCHVAATDYGSDFYFSVETNVVFSLFFRFWLVAAVKLYKMHHYTAATTREGTRILGWRGMDLNETHSLMEFSSVREMKDLFMDGWFPLEKKFLEVCSSVS